MSAGASGGGRPPPRRLYSLDEIDGTVRGRTGGIACTVADVVLLLLHADPRRPVRGRDRLAAQAFLAIREVMPEGSVEPVRFEHGPAGPRSDRLDATIDHLVFARYAEASGGPPLRDARLGITPKGRGYVAGRLGALPAGVGEKLAQKRLEWDTLAPAGLARYARALGAPPAGASFKGGRAGGQAGRK